MRACDKSIMLTRGFTESTRAARPWIRRGLPRSMRGVVAGCASLNEGAHAIVQALIARRDRRLSRGSLGLPDILRSASAADAALRRRLGRRGASVPGDERGRVAPAEVQPAPGGVMRNNARPRGGSATHRVPRGPAPKIDARARDRRAATGVQHGQPNQRAASASVREVLAHATPTRCWCPRPIRTCRSTCSLAGPAMAVGIHRLDGHADRHARSGGAVHRQPVLGRPRPNSPATASIWRRSPPVAAHHIEWLTRTLATNLMVDGEVLGLTVGRGVDKAGIVLRTDADLLTEAWRPPEAPARSVANTRRR